MAERLRERLAGTSAAFGKTLRNQNLRRLQLAAAGSLIGTWSYNVALIVYAYDVGGATAVAVAALIRQIPSALAAPFTAALGDRYRRVRVMVASDLIRAAAMFVAAVAVAADAAPLLVFTLAAVATVTATAFKPAQSALLPTLVRSPEELTASNVVTSTVQSVGIFIGPAIGGLLLAATGPDVVFAVNGATFLWSAALVAGVREGATDVRARPVGGVLSQMFAGFRTVRDEPTVRTIVVLIAAQTFVFGALTILVAVLALDLLDTGASGVGFLNSALGLGGLAGSIAAASLVGRHRLASSLGVGIFLWGLPLALVGFWPNQVVALLLFGVIGGANTVVDVSGFTLLQRTVPDDVLSRVFGVLQSVMVMTIAAGAAIAPILVALLGARAAFVITGSVLPVLAALSWRRLGILDSAAEAAPGRERELLAGVPMFGALPAMTLEQLAAALHPVRVASGERVFSQGDPGDRFYIVADGSVEVTVDGDEAGTLWPGEYFGEIAILRDVPRTATVTAREPSELLALERDDFLAAVTGSQQSLDAADAVVGARLGLARPSPA